MDLVWLKSTLKERGIKQREIAEVLGVAESTVTKLLNGDQIMKADQADTIRRHLGFRLPEDFEPNSLESKILRLLSVLDEHGKTSVALYVEALERQISSSQQQ